ncbi:MAG: hypothetical protein RR256_08100 [Bacteroidales bacterium]
MKGKKLFTVNWQNWRKHMKWKKGISNDEDLVRLVADEEGIDETAAAFGLAQFLLDYSDFIAENQEQLIINK